MASFMGCGFKTIVYDDDVLDYTVDCDVKVTNIRPDMTTTPPSITVDIIGLLKPNEIVDGVEERIAQIEVVANDVVLEPAGD